MLLNEYTLVPICETCNTNYVIIENLYEATCKYEDMYFWPPLKSLGHFIDIT